MAGRKRKLGTSFSSSGSRSSSAAHRISTIPKQTVSNKAGMFGSKPLGALRVHQGHVARTTIKRSGAQLRAGLIARSKADRAHLAARLGKPVDTGSVAASHAGSTSVKSYSAMRGGKHVVVKGHTRK